MLPRRHRLVDSSGFKEAVRRGKRAGSKSLVVHLLVPGTGPVADRETEPQVGFVVSKAVGPAVVRNRVKRRLRHQARESLSGLPGSAVLVVRALPAAADASYVDLGTDLKRCLARVLS